MTSPTENTEELEKVIAEMNNLQNTLLWIASRIRLAEDADRESDIKELEQLIASSNHQAVQAFGEKVLKESITVLPETFPTGARQSIDAVPVAVITSLLKGGVK